MSSRIEAFADENADGVLNPLQTSTAVGPVLATPAYAGYVVGAGAVFTLGLISDAVEDHHATEVTPPGPVPNYGSVDELLGMRVASIN